MIYFDNNATTPLDPRVLDEMMPFLTDHFGNAASKQHAMGWRAEEAVSLARTEIATALEVESKEIIFTSGATEACNLAIKGVFDLYKRKGKHLVLPYTEHRAVLDCVRYLQKSGAEITYLDVDHDGLVDPKALDEAIRHDTILVSVMWANNETGVIQPMEEIGKICAGRGTLLFSDATQAVGKIDVNPRRAGVQLLSFSGHKCYGPKGIGGLYCSQRSPRVRLEPLIHGGGHEYGFRSGTLNVPGIVGLGKAVGLALEDLPAFRTRMTQMRDYLEEELLHVGEVKIHSRGAPRLPHVSNFRFASVDGQALMAQLSTELAIASGSACTSADPEPSHVLMAMGLSRTEANSSLRISLGRFNADAELDSAIIFLRDAVGKL